MHFGRIDNFPITETALPADSPRTEKFLALPRGNNTLISVGCPIWSAKDWVGNLYPIGTKPTQFLRGYAQVFNCVELNSSFYHMPDGPRIAQWRAETPSGFRFCPKVFRGITENLITPHLPDLISQYCAAVSVFEDRLGLTFAQFSETFGPERLPQLEKFLALWPESVPLAVELRHRGWFQSHSLPDAVVNLFYRKKVSTVITDTAGRRDVLHFSLTQPKVLIRFQGNSGQPTDLLRIHEWAKRIRKWQTHSLSEIYFFTHQPTDHQIPITAKLAVREISGRETRELPPVPQRPKQLEML